MHRCGVRSMLGSFARVSLPPVENEPFRNFAPGTEERKALQAACKEVRSSKFDIPIVIGGKEFRPRSGVRVKEIPSNRHTELATYYEADDDLLRQAIASSLDAQRSWSRTPFQDRAAIILRAAALLSTTNRYTFEAMTMIGQSKNVWQAEIDAIGETVDFWRFHTKFAQELYATQPDSPSGTTTWNMTEYRPLEGFVAAISPFNFTAIGANLAATPVLLGNVVLWKPSPSAVLANYETLKVLEAAGLPPGVINFVPCCPSVMETALQHPSLAGVAFTGSTAVFKKIWQNVASNLEKYKNFPRVSGETGGKNFHLIHPSADIATVVSCTVRSAFEYQGQKCSACSRCFIPRSKAPEIRAKLLEGLSSLKMGQPDDFSSFLCAVIDEVAFKKISGYLARAAQEEGTKIIAGGRTDSSQGWFVEPTIIETSNLNAASLREEIFGPVLTITVYDDSTPSGWEQVCDDIDKGSAYGLTGSIFCLDRCQLQVAREKLRYASGMMYINDKSTGAVVGQQPFGGSRMSGTNDKPGGPSFLEKWVSARTVKESLVHNRALHYPHQLPDK